MPRTFALGAVPVGFVHDEEARDLHDSRFACLKLISEPWREHHDRDVRRGRDFHFVLPRAHRLEKDEVFACDLEQHERFERGARQASDMAPGRHAAHEDVRVVRGAVHARAVPEKRAAGEGARRVDGEHGDAAMTFAGQLGESVRERALADAGRSGQTDNERVFAIGEHPGQELASFETSVLDEGERPGEGPRLSFEKALYEVFEIQGNSI